MPKRIVNKCRRCRGTFNCAHIDEDHWSCKCGIDLRRTVAKKSELENFVRKRCCTAGATNAMVKRSRTYDPEMIIQELCAGCETCKFSEIGPEGWKRAKGFCNWDCCPSYSSPCLEAMRRILRDYPNRLSRNQAVDLEEVITATLLSDPEQAPAVVMEITPDLFFDVGTAAASGYTEDYAATESIAREIDKIFAEAEAADLEESTEPPTKKQKLDLDSSEGEKKPGDLSHYNHLFDHFFEEVAAEQAKLESTSDEVIEPPLKKLDEGVDECGIYPRENFQFQKPPSPSILLTPQSISCENCGWDLPPECGCSGCGGCGKGNRRIGSRAGFDGVCICPEPETKLSCRAQATTTQG